MARRIGKKGGKRTTKLPAQRTLEYIRKECPGVFIDKCERWIAAPNLPGGGIRKDLFGILDLIAIRDNRIVGIQCSGITGVSEHVKKIEESDAAIPWIMAGGLIEVWAFKKVPHGKQFRYEPKIVPITIPVVTQPTEEDWAAHQAECDRLEKPTQANLDLELP